MNLAAANVNIFRNLALLPTLFLLVACAETIPVKKFTEQKIIPGHVNCKLELGGYFHKKYGRKETGDRAVAKLQFTIPEAAFVNKQGDSKEWKYKLAADADNRVIFFVDGKTQAAARLTSIDFRDGSKNDRVEFNVSSAFGKIGFVEQNKDSLFVRLADSTGLVLSDSSNKADKDRDWTGFIDQKQSQIHLTDDIYRKRTLQTDAVTIDEIQKSCVG